MKPSMADSDLFQGVTKDWASLATLRASLNSPKSTISLNSSPEPEEVEVEDVLLLQAFMLNILREMESDPSWWSSHQPRFETKPARPTEAISKVPIGGNPPSPSTSLALNHIFPAEQPAPGRNLAWWSSSQRLSLPARTAVKVEEILSRLAASLEEAALPFSNSWTLIEVVSIFRRVSRGWLLTKLSENSRRKGNLALIPSRSRSAIREDDPPPLLLAGS